MVKTLGRKVAGIAATSVVITLIQLYTSNVTEFLAVTGIYVYGLNLLLEVWNRVMYKKQNALEQSAQRLISSGLFSLGWLTYTILLQLACEMRTYAFCLYVGGIAIAFVFWLPVVIFSLIWYIVMRASDKANDTELPK
jgi:hypothetical protein